MKLKSLALLIILFWATTVLAAVPVITQISDASSAVNTTYTASPSATNSPIIWYKLYGHDDLTVNSSTGAISWAIPSGFPREAYYVGVKACNADGCGTMTYILKVGGGNYRYVGSGQTYSTISAATAAASSGDTIVVKAMTSSSTDNQMANDGSSRGTLPPSGSSGVYTTVMAEYPGAVTLSGGTTNSMIRATGNAGTRNPDNLGTFNVSYIAFKGFIVTGGNATYALAPIMINHCSHIKITHILAYDAPGDASPIAIMRGTYNLVENCATWGKHRMGILFYIEDYGVMRRSVHRFDYSDATNPMVGFDAYATNYFRGQNLIDVDSVKKMDDATYDASALCLSVGGYGTGLIDNKISEAVVLNHEGRAINSSPNPGGEYGPIVFSNVVAYDLKAKDFNSEGIGNPIISTDTVAMSNLTLGKWASPDGPIPHINDTFIPYAPMINDAYQRLTIDHSIMFNFKDYGGATIEHTMYGMEAVNNVDIYQAWSISPIIAGGGSQTTITGTSATYDPTTNGLLYLPRIEAASTLKTAGASSTQIGATVMYMRGKSGTLWGETGYDTLTSVPMWPFPMEDLIKTKMCAYASNGVTGNRGFCLHDGLDGVHDTLTTYIWEYLGNQIPAEIYGAAEDVTPPTLSSFTIQAGGTTAIAAFNESVTHGAGSTGGWTSSLSGGACTITYASGAPGTTLTYNLGRTVYKGETGTIAYTQPGNGVEDSAGNDLATVASLSITNSSTQDNTAPTVTANDTTKAISTNSYSAQGSASDDTSVSGCKWRLVSAPDATHGTACTGTTSWTCSTSGYSSGSNTLYVGCYDAAGNYGTDTVTVTYTPSGGTGSGAVGVTFGAGISFR
jgi:hypothetical protein